MAIKAQFVHSSTVLKGGLIRQCGWIIAEQGLKKLEGKCMRLYFWSQILLERLDSPNVNVEHLLIRCKIMLILNGVTCVFIHTTP